MKTQISSFELYYLVQELQMLVEGKVDNIYHPVKEEVIFTIHVPNTGKKILRILAGKCMYIAEGRESAAEPDNFCVFLRKHLDNARIREISQIEPERIVKMVFEKKEGKKSLLVELFGKGNILLLDENDLILAATDYHKFKDRTIRPRETYSFPKKEPNVFRLSLPLLDESLHHTEKDSLGTFLAVDLGLGGLFSEEVCLKSHIEKTKKPRDLSSSERKKVLECIDVLKHAPLQPRLIKKEGKIIEIVPIETEFFAHEDTEITESLSRAIEKGSMVMMEKKKSTKEHALEKLQVIIRSQEDKIKELELAEADTRGKGELIFSHYRLIDSLITELRAIEKKHSWHEIRDTLNGHKIVKDVNVKDKKITIELN